MIIQTHTAKTDERYLTAAGMDPAACIYFDIETTGLKASTSHLYLIGYAVRERCVDAQTGDVQVIQLFAENTADEKLLLARFAEACAKYRTVIHFNGDRFDIPYLEEKYREYGMPSPFRAMSTLDIYRMLRPFKAVLGLERLNQKSVETFLGIRRRDRYDGGQLIGVYRAYRDGLSACREEDLDKLMLHNYEDVLGMLALTALIAYPLALGGGRKDTRTPIREEERKKTGALSDGNARKDALENTDEDERTGTGAPADREYATKRGMLKLVKTGIVSQPASVDGARRTDLLRMTCRTPVPVPVPVTMEKDLFRIDLYANTMDVSAALTEETLYHYFADYKNYYYLPLEDRAIHKSVARFMDSSHREKARADTCYVKKAGRFLPVPPGAEYDRETYPAYRHDRKEKTEWVELTDRLLNDLTGGGAAIKYLRLILESVSVKNKSTYRKGASIYD